MLRRIKFDLIILIYLAGLAVSFFWIYTTFQLQVAESRGVYPSAEAGMRAKIENGYVGIEKIIIDHAGTNSFDGDAPHVWYVSARVWADERVGGAAVGNGRIDYDNPGSFYIHTKAGWVFVPEGAFPELIGFGMQVFKLTPAAD
jgi:hypothetical protein